MGKDTNLLPMAGFLGIMGGACMWSGLELTQVDSSGLEWT